MMTAKMGERDSREEIMKAFRLFDDDETGVLAGRRDLVTQLAPVLDVQEPACSEHTTFTAGALMNR